MDGRFPGRRKVVDPNTRKIQSCTRSNIYFLFFCTLGVWSVSNNPKSVPEIWELHILQSSELCMSLYSQHSVYGSWVINSDLSAQISIVETAHGLIGVTCGACVNFVCSVQSNDFAAPSHLPLIARSSKEPLTDFSSLSSSVVSTKISNALLTNFSSAIGLALTTRITYVPPTTLEVM